MNLAFLSVDAASDHGDVHPVATSAIDRAQRDIGATFEERGGWLVPVAIPATCGTALVKKKVSLAPRSAISFVVPHCGSSRLDMWPLSKKLE